MNETMTTAPDVLTDTESASIPETTPTTAVSESDGSTQVAVSAKESDAPQGDGASMETDGAEAPEASPTQAVYLPVYKGKVVPVKADDREEITTLLQLGMKQRDMMPLMDELTEIAACCGAKSIKELVTLTKQTLEESRLARAIAAFGEDEGRRYYEKNKALLLAANRTQEPTSEPTLEQYLAEEFAAVKAVYPQYETFADIPREVVHTALCENLRLTDALGRYEAAERAAREEEGRRSARTANRATGTLAGTAGNTSDSVMDAFVKGLYGRL